MQHSLVMIVLASTLGLPAVAQEPTTPHSRPVAYAHPLAQQVADLASTLDAARTADREKASKAVEEVSKALTNTLMQGTRATDPDLAQRSRAAMESLERALAQAKLLALCSPDRRDAVAAQIAGKSKLLTDLISRNDTVAVPAVTALTKGDAELADAVVRLCIQQASPPVRVAALQSALSMSKTSPELNKELIAHLETIRPKRDVALRVLMNNAEVTNYSFSLLELEGRERQMVLTVLGNQKDALPLLISVILDKVYQATDDAYSSAMILSKYDDKRLVVTLMDHIAATGPTSTFDFGPGKKLSVVPGDIAIAAIVLQTKQSLDEYDFLAYTHLGKTYIGFAKEEDRKAARVKLTAWFANHKKEYIGIDKIVGKMQMEDKK